MALTPRLRQVLPSVGDATYAAEVAQMLSDGGATSLAAAQNLSDADWRQLRADYPRLKPFTRNVIENAQVHEHSAVEAPSEVQNVPPQPSAEHREKQCAPGVIARDGRAPALDRVGYVPVTVGKDRPRWTQNERTDSIRTLIGTLVLGPSGSGKTVYMAKGVAAELAAASRLRSPEVVTIYTKLVELEGCGDGANEVQLKEGVAALLTTLKPRFNFKGKYVVICVDEIGVSPGVLAEPSTWESLAAEAHEALTRADVGSRGVHIVAGGTAAELRSKALASDCPTVRKVRLPQWTLEQVLSMQPKGAAQLNPVLQQLCALSPGIRAAVTNPRMARNLLEKLNEKFLQRAVVNENEVDVDYLANQQAWLLHEVVSEYVDMNGLQSLVAQSGPNVQLRGVVRGVAVGALRMCMRQCTQDVQECNASSTARVDPHSKLNNVCALAAEHFGLLTCNWKANGKVEAGHLQYEMHAGTVLVALHLAGLKVAEMSCTWAALEELTGLALLFEAVSDLTLTATNRFPQDSMPRALRGQKLPCVKDPIRVLHWDAETKPGPRRTSSSSAKPKTEFCVLLPSEPTAVIAEPMAPTADVIGYRCFAQCKYTAPRTVKPSVAAISKEIAKSGLLTDSSTNQKDLLGALTRWWGALGHKGNARRAADFAPGASMIGPRHMYPLNLLMASGSHGPATASTPLHWWTPSGQGHPSFAVASSDNMTIPGKTAVRTPPAAEPVAADLPRPPRASAASTQSSDARGSSARAKREHSAWCEFRFVATDVCKIWGNQAMKNPDTMSRTLAVYSRQSADDPTWRLVFGPPQLKALKDFEQNLRTDVPLTLVAITVCHMCDCKQLASPQPEREEEEEEEDEEEDEEVASADASGQRRAAMQASGPARKQPAAKQHERRSGATKRQPAKRQQAKRQQKKATTSAMKRKPVKSKKR